MARRDAHRDAHLTRILPPRMRGKTACRASDAHLAGRRYARQSKLAELCGFSKDRDAHLTRILPRIGNPSRAGGRERVEVNYLNYSSINQKEDWRFAFGGRN